jgi:hypothetical protein
VCGFVLAGFDTQINRSCWVGLGLSARLVIIIMLPDPLW